MSAAFVLPLALRAHALATPGATAIVEPGRAWTFAALDAHAGALARGLRAAGVRGGDRVALLAAPSGEAIALLAAVARVGACAAPLGTRLTAPELSAAAGEIGPRVTVVDEDHADAASALGVLTLRLHQVGADHASTRDGGREAGPRAAGSPLPGALRPGPDEPLLDLDPAAPAVAVLTSGTSGRPKAALLSNAAMAASAAAWSAALPPASGWLLCLGLAHVAGLGVVWRAIGAGVPLRVLPVSDATALLVALGETGVSHVSLVPTQLARLLEPAGGARGTGRRPAPDRSVPGDPGDAAAAGLRAVLLGGAPIPQELVTRALAVGWPVVPTYGLTEAGSGVTALATADAATRPGSAGRALPGVELRILDPAADGSGEILVRTPACFSGYLARPEATAVSIDRDGWLRTGDAGRLDAAGFLQVLDRREDLFVSGGESVYPAEVEAVIEGHPGVVEAGVVGRPDPTWGSVPLAAVVIRPGTSTPTEVELRSYCVARLAPYKVPAAFLVLRSLPRTTSGKLRRAELRDLLLSGQAAHGAEVLA